MTEAYLIDSNCVLSCEVLLRTREESLWEEESRDPEHLWCSIVIPARQEVDTVVAVLDPRSKRFLTEEAFTFSLVTPHGWDLVIIDRCRHLLQVLRHDQLTNESLLDFA